MLKVELRVDTHSAAPDISLAGISNSDHLVIAAGNMFDVDWLLGGGCSDLLDVHPLRPLHVNNLFVADAKLSVGVVAPSEDVALTGKQ